MTRRATLRSRSALAALATTILALALLGQACGDADYTEEDENNSSSNNNQNNNQNNNPNDPCADLSPDACEADPRCELRSISAPCAGDEECPSIAELVCVQAGCFTDADCPSGYGCVVDHGFSNNEPGCDCPPCAPGEDCVCACDGSTGDAIAPAPQPTAGYCAPQEPGCYSDAECGPNQRCQILYDVPCYCPPCEPGEECPECDCGGGGGALPPDGICVDVEVPCWGDADCGPNQFCDPSFGVDEPQPEPFPCDCACEEGEACDCACDQPAPEPPYGICRERNTWCSWDGDCAPGERCEFGPVPPDCACPVCEEGEPCEPCDCGGAPAPGGMCVPAQVECGDSEPVFCDAEPPICRGGVVVARGGCWACVDPVTCEDVMWGGWCDDGSALVCNAIEPTCPPNAISAVQDGCWSCVDPETCAPVAEPGGCEDISDAIICSELGCSWFECPQDVQCEAPGGACFPNTPPVALPFATLTPDCAPDDGPAYRLMAGEGPLACGEVSRAGRFVEIYSWAYGADQLEAGASYDLSGAITYCEQGDCAEGLSGALYLGDDAEAGRLSGQVLFYFRGDLVLFSFEAERCMSLGFCG